MITNVYGPKKQEDKLKLFISLEDLRAIYPNFTWILIGDFNMIRSFSEKKEVLDRWEEIPWLSIILE